jgi:hypothetical protein
MLFSNSWVGRGLALATIPMSSAQSFQPCPIIGPRFPVPSGLSADPIILEAMKNTTKVFDDLVATGGGEAHGDIAPNSTSFSIALFSATDPLNSSSPLLFEYHYAAPSLAESTTGAKMPDSNSVYRIGSLTQVFTIWMTLIEAGEAAWVTPVTQHIPELAQAAEQASSIDRTAWEDITLGDLAAHLSGISRDCGCLDMSFRVKY